MRLDAPRIAFQPCGADVHIAVGAQLDETVARFYERAQPVQTGRVAAISMMSMPSASPTVTVLVTGSMSST